MKLIQQIALSYYSIKIRSISFFSPTKGAEKAFDLFCTPMNGRMKRQKPSIFNQATLTTFSINNLSINGWHWLPENKQLPIKTILIVHGFDSSSYRFEKYIPYFLQAGYQVYAFDGPAHGVSEGKYINSLLYKEMILKAAKEFGPFHGIMAHSLGALATSLAVDEDANITNKLVLIAPATESVRALQRFAHFLKLSPRISKSIDDYVVKIANQPLSWFSVNRTVSSIKKPILWLHDKKDDICPFEDIQPSLQKQLPNVEFYITEGLGHSKIYRDKHSIEKITSFLTQE
ncbi:MAG: alpha/beta hydrolase [Chitinophagaceae bacterium]